MIPDPIGQAISHAAATGFRQREGGHVPQRELAGRLIAGQLVPWQLEQFRGADLGRAVGPWGWRLRFRIDLADDVHDSLLRSADVGVSSTTLAVCLLAQAIAGEGAYFRAGVQGVVDNVAAILELLTTCCWPRRSRRGPLEKSESCDAPN